MNINQILNSLIRKQSETGELINRFDLSEIVGRFRKPGLVIRHRADQIKAAVVSFLTSVMQPASIDESSNSHHDFYEGFDETRFTIFFSRLQRRFPRYAEGKVFGFILRVHQLIIADRFQFSLGLIVGVVFWLFLIWMYRWIF